MDTITKNDLETFRNLIVSDIERLMKVKTTEADGHEVFGWLRSKAIRKILGISAATLQNLRIAGKIRFKKILGSYYYNKEDLENLFKDEK
ncbi:helix-turn-helix domain-containing protein [Chryseobacterium sp. CBSDS_008]|uniref:helix-turn-helix domain-containing protein n=1 Tax=Chryseobacterium sp. CBSDS_008 TaxID=3415265 RepID=UPI003CECF0D3